MKHPVKHLPLWDVMGNTLVTTDGALWRAFELLPRDSLQMTEAALETLSKTIYTLGSAELQPNLALQIQADIHKERQSHLSAYHNIQSGNALLNRQRIMRHRHLKSAPNREIRLTLMVGWRPQSNKEFPKLSRATHQAREEHLREAIQSLTPIFHNGGGIDG